MFQRLTDPLTGHLKVSEVAHRQYQDPLMMVATALKNFVQVAFPDKTRPFFSTRIEIGSNPNPLKS